MMANKNKEKYWMYFVEMREWITVSETMKQVTAKKKETKKFKLQIINPFAGLEQSIITWIDYPTHDNANITLHCRLDIASNNSRFSAKQLSSEMKEITNRIN